MTQNASVQRRRPAPAVVPSEPVSATKRARRRWFSPSEESRAEEVVGRLYVQHRGAVIQFLRRCGVADGQVEDVCQDVFLVVRRRLSSFEGNSSVSTWLLGIARRVAADHRRSAWVRREVTQEAPELGSAEPAQLELLERGERVEQLRRALALLQPSSRRILVRHDFDELPMRVIAQRENVPLQTAYSRLHAARKLLAKTLEAQA